MSAVALIPQDTAGLSAFIARKTPSGAQDDDPDADFSAALAQTADAAPASTTPSPTTPADASLPNSGDEIWRRLSAFSDEATAPQTAVEADAPSPQAQGDLPGAATEDRKAALPALLSKAQEAEKAGRQDARAPTKPDATPALATASDTALARPSRAASSNATSSLPSAPLAPERVLRPPDKTAAKTASTSDRTASKAETRVSKSCPSNPPAACPDQDLVALTVSPPPAEKSASPLASPSSEQDSVTRIGAALAFPGGAQKPAASDPGLKQARYSEAEPQEGTATAIHVVAQQTWLQPVSPVFSPGLSRQAAADRAGLEAPQAAGGQTEDSTGGKTEDSAGGKNAVSANGKEAAAVETDSRGLLGSAPEKTPQTPFASLLSPGANLAPGRDALSKPDAAAGSTSTSDGSQRSLMAAPRRDLEITLAPKELGGLEVRMKSAGDRLELAFVADRGETARLISDKSAALTSQLRDAGIGLGGIDISATSPGPGGSGDAPTGGRPPDPSGGDSNPAPQRQQTSGRDRQDRENETNDQTGDARPRGERGFYL
jgi:flagellar hook-length control protein FliK